MTLWRYVCNTTSSTSDIQMSKYGISFCLLQRVLELDAHVIRHEFIYVDEVGFNLPKTRRHGRDVIGQRPITNVPGQRGDNITMCAAITQNGVLHTGSVQHWPYAHFSGYNLHNACP